MCGWFPQAVKLLQQNRQLDVGVHLALTSEWDNFKWRPLTTAPSLTTDDGYFYHSYQQREGRADEVSFAEADWKIDEVEQELRAQMALTMKHIPWCSHAGIHMGGIRADEKIKAVFETLLAEYDLIGVDLEPHDFSRFRGFGDNSQALSSAEKEATLIEGLKTLGPGKWLFVDHPAYDTPEMRHIYHKGYEKVAEDRQGVTDAWTSEVVKAIIAERGIKLISYADVKHGTLD